MAIKNFPYVALFIGIAFMLAVYFGGQIDPVSNNTRLPLLTLLLICEFAFFLMVAASYMTIKHMLSVGVNSKSLIVATVCIFSAVTFLVKGLTFWPSSL